MNKYDKFNSYQEVDENILGNDENVLFDLRPKKLAFIINRIIYMLPVVLIWLFLDIVFISTIFAYDTANIAWLFIPFFVIQLIPIGLWFYNVLNSSKRWENTRYIITDKRIIIRNGFAFKNYRVIFYQDIANVHLKTSIIDKLLKVGDIRFDVMGSISDGNGDTTLLDIEGADSIFGELQKTIMSNQTDVEYSDSIDEEDKI